jgi:hypothetical protein
MQWLQARALELQQGSGLPSTFHPSDPDAPEVKALTALLAQLEERRFFAINTDTGGVVAYVLIGRLQGTDGWTGLLGVGIASD